MTDIFVGDNDHGDTPLPPLSDLLWAEVTKLRQDKVRLEEDIVHFANELNEVTRQRDYARKLYCSRISTVTSTYVESSFTIKSFGHRKTRLLLPRLTSTSLHLLSSTTATVTLKPPLIVGVRLLCGRQM